MKMMYVWSEESDAYIWSEESDAYVWSEELDAYVKYLRISSYDRCAVCGAIHPHTVECITPLEKLMVDVQGDKK